MKIKSVHIGEEILSRLNQLNISKSEFGRMLGIPQQNVNRIFEKQSIDTGKLIKICSALQFNFFSLYYDEDRIDGLGKLTIHATDNSHAAGRDINIGTSVKEAKLEKENQELRQQLIEAQSKIIRLMEDKDKQI